MSIQLVAYNVVIAARQLNPSVFNQLWLARNDLVGEGELEPGWVFTEPLVQVRTRQFVLLVVPEQLQFVPLIEGEPVEPLVMDKVGRIVTRLPHTPYTAIGFNFVWHMVPEETTAPQLGRQLFFKEESAFFRQFNTDDAQFGGYASKNIFGCRLKVDVKPVTTLEEPRERMQFAFNYHKDLTAPVEAVPAIEEMLRHWNEARAMSSQIIESIESRGTP